MKVKAKKQNADGNVKMETSGEIREIIINEDFLHPKQASIAICFRGKHSSGIVELTPDEIRAARRCTDAYFLCIEFTSRMTYLPARSTRILSPDADPGNAWDDVVRWYEQEQ